MKLFKTLMVGNKKLKLFQEDVRLHLRKPSRATFHVSGSVKRGLVTFDIGYKANRLERYFFGYVESITPLEGNHSLLFCREFTAVLNQKLPLYLKHVTLNDVLKAISNITALQFIVPDKDYAGDPAPCIAHYGQGYHLMDTLGKVFLIDNYTWYQQADGRVYVGSFDDTYFRNNPIQINPSWFTDHGVSNSANINAIPKLRAGVIIEQKGIVDAVELKQSIMKIHWRNKLWMTQY